MLYPVPAEVLDALKTLSKALAKGCALYMAEGHTAVEWANLPYEQRHAFCREKGLL